MSNEGLHNLLATFVLNKANDFVAGSRVENYEPNEIPKVKDRFQHEN